MSRLALSDSFEYLCHWSMAIINILILSVLGLPTSECDIYRCQILTHKDGPLPERINIQGEVDVDIVAARI